MEEKNLYELRPDQIEDIDWLIERRRAVLGNVAGVGKSPVALIAAQQLVNGLIKQPLIVVICPTSLKGNWQDESDKWTPIFRSQILRTGRDVLKADTHLCITTEKLFQKLIPKLERRVDVLIIDEAHEFKNPDAKYANMLHYASKNIPFTWALSGTILPNAIAELWIWYSFCMRGKGLPYWEFAKRYGYVKDGYWGKSAYGTRKENLQELLDIIKPWLKRRTLEEVLPFLPESQDIHIKLEPTAEVQKILDRGEVGREALKRIMSGEPEPGDEDLLENIGSLRSELGVFKGAACMQVINNLALQEAVVVGAHHQTTINSMLDASSSPAKVINGRVPESKRADIVREFQRGEFQTIFLGVKSAGVGLTLTRSRIACLVEPTFVPEQGAQFFGRVKRTGQTRGTLHYYFYYPNSFDEDVLLYTQRKAKELHKFWSAFESGVVPDEPCPFQDEEIEFDA